MASQKEVAAHIDLSLNRLKEYISKGIIPRTASLDEARVAYIRHLRAEKGGVTQQRNRLDTARAEVTELQAAKIRGDLVPAEDQAAAIISLASVTSSRLRAIPVRVAPDLAEQSDRARCREIVEIAIDEALTDLAAAGGRTAS